MKHYAEIIKEEIIQKQKTGQSVSSLSKEYGISRYAIQSWCGLRPEKEIIIAAPRRRGRPRKNQLLTEKEKDNEIKRLTIDLSRNYNGGGENTGFNGFSPPLNSRFRDRSNTRPTSISN